MIGNVVEGRRERKRRETRHRLLAAARQLIVERGIDGLTIAEVTDSADVGFGTFYGYFETKEALLEAVAAAVFEELGTRNDALTAGIDDPVVVTAIGLLSTLDAMEHDPMWTTLLARIGASDDPGRWQALSRRMIRDVESAAAIGRFPAARVRVAPFVVGGSVMAALRSSTEHPMSGADRDELMLAVLMALGLVDSDARAVLERAHQALT